MRRKGRKDVKKMEERLKIEIGSEKEKRLLQFFNPIPYERRQAQFLLAHGPVGLDLNFHAIHPSADLRCPSSITLTGAREHVFRTSSWKKVRER